MEITHLTDWIISIVLLLILFLLAIRLKNYFRAVFLAFSLSGPVAYPFIGNAFLINDSKKLEYIGSHGYRMYGPIMRSWISIVPLFFVSEPAHLQTILGNGKLTKKNMLYSLLHNFIGEGLITNDGEKWKLHRKLIQPFFHMNILENFVGAFDETARDLVKRLRVVDTVNITGYINNWVLDTLHRTVLGIPLSGKYAETSPFRKGILVVPYRISRPWMLLDFFFNFTKSYNLEKKQRYSLYDFTEKILDERENISSNSTTKSVCLLDIFSNIAESNPNFSKKNIIDEACTFMLAGQDSVGAAVAFSLYFLAKHQDIQEKVYQEQMQIFDVSLRDTNINDLGEMKYLEQCIKETMRLCPSVPVICRELKQDVILGEHTLPTGANIGISPFLTHRLEHLYEDPLKYDPDRFSADNIANIHPYGYIPFSAGPRNCIGYKFALLEMKSVISMVIRNYHLRLLPEKQDLNLSYRITLRAKGGIWLKLTERS